MGTYRNPQPPVGALGNSSALLWLGAADFNAESSGRKAASLHGLLLAGLPVAPGFIVPPQIDVNGFDPSAVGRKPRRNRHRDQGSERSRCRFRVA